MFHSVSPWKTGHKHMCNYPSLLARISRFCMGHHDICPQTHYRFYRPWSPDMRNGSRLLDQYRVYYADKDYWRSHRCCSHRSLHRNQVYMCIEMFHVLCPFRRCRHFGKVGLCMGQEGRKSSSDLWTLLDNCRRRRKSLVENMCRRSRTGLHNKARQIRHTVSEMFNYHNCGIENMYVIMHMSIINKIFSSLSGL